jgi:hypothetical protein
MFALNAKGFPTGCQEMHLRRRRKDLLGKRRRTLDHMLAAIEDQQHTPIAQEADQTGSRIAGSNGQSKRQGHRARYERRIIDRAKVDEANATSKLFKQSMTNRNGHSGFADSTGSGDSYESFGH